MRTQFISFLPRPHHGFGARRQQLRVRAVRALRHWLRQATDRAIAIQLTDAQFNPFLYVNPRC